MIRIHPGYVKDSEGHSTLSTDIEIDGTKTNVYLTVEPQYGKFFSPERADYALIGLLAYAMRHGHDIICDVPVTEELLYNIREILLPTLVRSDSRGYHTKIQADIAPPLDKFPVANYKLGGGRNRSIFRRRQRLHHPQAFQFRLSQSKSDSPLHFPKRQRSDR